MSAYLFTWLLFNASCPFSSLSCLFRAPILALACSLSFVNLTSACSFSTCMRKKHSHKCKVKHQTWSTCLFFSRYASPHLELFFSAGELAVLLSNQLLQLNHQLFGLGQPLQDFFWGPRVLQRCFSIRLGRRYWTILLQRQHSKTIEGFVDG